MAPSEFNFLDISNKKKPIAISKGPYILHSPKDSAISSGHKHRNCDHIVTGKTPVSFNDLIIPLINNFSVADLKNKKINPQSQRKKNTKKIPTEQ